VRPAERLDQPVIAPARQDRSLRTQLVGDELECRVAVVIEAADEPRRSLPLNARGVPGLGDLGEEIRASLVRKSSITGALSTAGQS
jgi:hypothetical protein